MARQIAIYHNCARTDGPYPGQCKLERFKEPGQPLTFGRVLGKCAGHRNVPDDELPVVLTRESLAVRDAAVATPEDQVLSCRFEGSGASRVLVASRLPKRADG